MKSIPTAMQTDLDGHATKYCYCWEIEVRDQRQVFPASFAQWAFSEASLAYATVLWQTCLPNYNSWKVNIYSGTVDIDSHDIAYDPLTDELYRSQYVSPGYGFYLDIDVSNVLVGTSVRFTPRLRVTRTVDYPTANFVAAIQAYTQAEIDNVAGTGYNLVNIGDELASIDIDISNPGVYRPSIAAIKNDPDYVMMRVMFVLPPRNFTVPNNDYLARISQPQIIYNPIFAPYLGFTDHDKDVTFNGIVHRANTGMDPSALSASRNLDVDDMDAIGILEDDRITHEDIAAGVYDDAFVTVYKVNWEDPTKRVVIHKGPIGKIQRGSIGYKAQINSLSDLANREKGRVYGPKCNWLLGGEECGVNLQTPDYQDEDLEVTAVISNRIFETTTAAVLLRDADFFTRGKVTWNTGNNTNLTQAVRTSFVGPSTARFELLIPMPYDIEVGDLFNAQAGCDLLHSTCNTKFGNIVNFGGYPRKPLNDFILSSPKSDELNDGGSLYE